MIHLLVQCKINTYKLPVLADFFKWPLNFAFNNFRGSFDFALPQNSGGII